MVGFAKRMRAAEEGKRLTGGILGAQTTAQQRPQPATQGGAKGMSKAFGL